MSGAGARTDKGWIQTFTGRKVWPLYLRAEDIDIVDIAHALARICRFNGHVRESMSVGHHSILVSTYCSPEDSLAGLLHDASEAYLLDIPSPIKSHPQFQFYRDAERRAQIAIGERFGVELVDLPVSVLAADRYSLQTEIRDLMAPGEIQDWAVEAGQFGYAPFHRIVRPWSAALTERVFTDRFEALRSEGGAAQIEDRKAYIGSWEPLV